MCDTAFSALINMKTKYRSRLTMLWVSSSLVSNSSENW